MKIINLIAISIFLVIATTSSVYAQNEVEQTIDSTQTIIIKVKGADCSNDLVRIASNVEKQIGVSSCELVTEGVVSKFEVTYNPALISKKDVHAAVENTGGCGNPDARPYTVKNK